VIASGELDGHRWEYRARIDGSRLKEYFTAPGGAEGRSTLVPSGAITCLGWGGELRPGRPSGWLMHVRGVVRKAGAVHVHLSDGTVIEADVVDIGDPSIDFFIAVFPPRSAMWQKVVAIALDGTELGDVLRNARRR
jgi:hypothetical protein